MNAIIGWLASNFPQLGPAARVARAARDCLLPRKLSYAQHGEDAYILSQLAGYELSKGIYVDVGASHPTIISNTYLFYRLGLHGLTIEPNLEYVHLHRRYRRRDSIIAAGCAAAPGLAEFEVSKTPVLSRISIPQLGQPRSGSALRSEVLRRELIPVVTLDAALERMTFEWIFLLSVDVEGLDLDVLRGGQKWLPRVLFVCAEANDAGERQDIDAFLRGMDFRKEREIACNLVYRNNRPAFGAFIRQRDVTIHDSAAVSAQ